ncbi:MAG: PadR family transcriptional regulator [Acidobacteria bacterium]|nr:PadR family transcriptional regulator [Acidobacteriota bacterium]
MRYQYQHEHFRGFRGGEDFHGMKEQLRERFCTNFGDFGRGRHGGRGGRGPWGGRMFGSGDLRYVILQLISEKPSHGYEIIKSIQERLGGTYAPSPGVVYPMLTMLEEMGHIAGSAEGSRKQYTITEEGAKALAENKTMVDALFSRIENLRQEYARQRPQQIERAVENLRMALRMKMGSLTTEQINAVTDIIDAAAKQIERV